MKWDFLKGDVYTKWIVQSMGLRGMFGMKKYSAFDLQLVLLNARP